MAQALLDLTGAAFRTPAGVVRVGALCLGGPGLIGVVGPNGGGKSTLLRCLGGLHPRIDSGKAAPRPALRSRLMLQHPEWQLHAPTVRRQLGTGGPRLQAAIERFGIGALLEASPYQLSSGQRRRVMLAALFASDAPVLLLDEPTASLDEPGRREMILACRELAADRLIVAATHDWSWMVEDAGHALWVENLAVVDEGPPRRLVERLGPDDGPELLLWVTRLQAEGYAVRSWWDPQALALELIAARRASS